MTAATKDVTATRKLGADNVPQPALYGLPVAANVEIFAGTFGASNASGQAVPATSAAAIMLWGRVERQVNNLTSNAPYGAAGAQNVLIKSGAYYFSSDGSVTAGMMGQPVFALDDNTVTTNPTVSTATYWLPFAGIVVPPGEGDFGFSADPTKIPVYVGDPGPSGTVLHATIDVPLATIAAQTSGTAFNIGPGVLPANAAIVASDINVVQLIAGGSIATHVYVQVQNSSGDSAGALLGGSTGLNVFTGQSTGLQVATGSNPYAQRGGQQLQMTITTGSGALSGATAGHLQVNLFYTILQ